MSKMNIAYSALENIHTSVPRRTNIPGFWGKRNIPWDYHEMSNIPGGDEGIDAFAPTLQNRA